MKIKKLSTQYSEFKDLKEGNWFHIYGTSSCIWEKQNETSASVVGDTELTYIEPNRMVISIGEGINDV